MAVSNPGIEISLGDEDSDDTHEKVAHPVFTEMLTLSRDSAVAELIWKESARWVKFEESVEEGGQRWSKPHVSTMALHNCTTFRNLLEHSSIIFNLKQNSFSLIIDSIVSKLQEDGKLTGISIETLKTILLSKFVHQHDLKSTATDKLLKRVRSVADAGRIKSCQTMANHTATHDGDFNVNFKKKLPSDSECSLVLVGNAEWVSEWLCVFVRLNEATVISNLCEVDIPTRFLFVLLGPGSESVKANEMGRVMGTLMTDELFRDVAYEAENKQQLLEAVDQFLEQVTILPPGEWDPSIRVEPPAQTQSKQERMQRTASVDQLGDTAAGHGQGDMQHGADGDDHLVLKAHDPQLMRTGKWFGGLRQDINRKLRWYKSDYLDALHFQSVSVIVFMFFANLAPTVTFGGLMAKATHKQMGTIENMLAAVVCGVTHNLFAGQPLSIPATTGPLLIFEMVCVQLSEALQIDYMSFRVWICVWGTLIMFILVATDASAVVSLVTRYTEEAFATLIAILFMYEAVHNVFEILVQPEYEHVSEYHRPHQLNFTHCQCSPPSSPVEHNADWFEHIREEYFTDWNVTELYEQPWVIQNGSMVDVNYALVPLDYCHDLKGVLRGNTCYKMEDVFLMSLILMVGTFLLAQLLRDSRHGRLFPTKIRRYVSDFAVSLAIVFMVVLDLMAAFDTPKLIVPVKFEPTNAAHRGWVINPWLNASWTYLFALLPAILGSIVIFMDQHISTIIASRKENKLAKGGGYHLDLFILMFHFLGCGIFGLPMFVAETVLSMTHVDALKIQSEVTAPGQTSTFAGVREQRVTGTVVYILTGISIFAAPMLKIIPMPVLYGVFLYMGYNSLNSQLWDRILLMLMPMKWQPDHMYLRQVPIATVHWFTLSQIGCILCLWLLKSFRTTAILFPLMLIVMVIVRKLLERFFHPQVLMVLDDEIPDVFKLKLSDQKGKTMPDDNGAAALPKKHSFLPWKKSSRDEVEMNEVTNDKRDTPGRQPGYP